jgi:hypothetical protein
MSNFKREMKTIIVERQETDREMVHRFSQNVYEDSMFVISFTSCHKLNISLGGTCHGCQLNMRDGSCKLQLIRDYAKDVMEATR